MFKKIFTVILFTISILGIIAQTPKMCDLLVGISKEMKKTDTQRRQEKDAYYAQDTYTRKMKQAQEQGYMIGSILFYFLFWMTLIYTYRRLRKKGPSQREHPIE
ncbi:MAG: hypothetical protein AAF380_02445 [Bacteroidota bacterium]